MLILGAGLLGAEDSSPVHMCVRCSLTCEHVCDSVGATVHEGRCLAEGQCVYDYVLE